MSVEEVEEVEVDFEEVKKRLVKEVLEHPDKYPEEAKLILTIEAWSRQGEAFTDEQRYEVLKGKVIEVVLREWDEGYPYRSGAEIALIPLEVPTVVEVHRYSNTTDPPENKCVLYVFTSEGWKSIKVY
jgi:hypothetical protein